MELVSCQPPDDFLLPGVLSFNALMGLSCYIKEVCQRLYDSSFNALMGLSCYQTVNQMPTQPERFNALMGLSCYCKNVQYFKFFMILFMHPCYL